MDRLEELPTTDGQVSVTWLTADSWWQLDPPDMRGYQWRPPGTFVVAADATGTHIASIQLHFAYSTHGSPFTERVAIVLAEALRGVYQDAGQ